MERWQGKIAVVTGASAGIGAAICAMLVSEGVIVAGFARRSERVANQAKSLVTKKGKLHAVRVDITSEEQIIKGFKWVTKNLGPVSILVNNAGVGQNNTLIDGDTDMWRKVLDTNVLGLCVATREAANIMKASQIDGHIIHINSVAGHSVPFFPKINVYAASKHAVTALTETLRQELVQIQSRVKITSISPGAVKTDIIEASGIEINDEFLERIKAMPVLQPEDVAAAVLYVLATPPAVQVHELIIKPVGEPI